VFTGKDARESAFKAARRARLVVLAAPAFYLDDMNDPALVADSSGREGKPADPSAKPAADAKKAKVLESPLLRCGLALAGANTREDQDEAGNEGVLTGFDIAGADLRGTEVVVLPAAAAAEADHCGEAVAALAQAFQLAGSPAVVTASWPMYAADQTTLLAAFFNNLGNIKLRGKSLRQAQLSIIQKHREGAKAAHPYYWAGLTLTGRW
jgi:hypothetical protein